MNAVSFDSAGKWDTRVPLLIIGAGVAGICGALAAKEAGVEAVVTTGLTPDVGGEALRAVNDALGALKARAGGGNEPG